MNLTHFDRALIHGMGLMSRPPLIPEPAGHVMLAGILSHCAARAERAGPVGRLIEAARHVHADERLHRGTAHLIARAMDEFDREMMGVHWDAARGAK